MKRLLIAGLLLLPFASALAVSDEKDKNSPQKAPDKKTTKAAGGAVEVTLQSTITGNREQPKVLYIVPWQAPDGPESLRQGFQSDLDELFKPVERDEFLRQLKHKTTAQNDTADSDK